MKGGVAKVLYTDWGVPNTGFFSWTQLLEYVTQQYPDNNFDYLICGPTDSSFHSSFTKRIICTENSKLRNRVFKNKRFNAFETALLNIISNHEFVIVAVMDSIKLQNFLYQFLVENKMQHKVRIVFCQHGHSYYLTVTEYLKFKQGISEIVLLSHESYKYEFNRYPDIPYPVHVLHNPINHTIFKPLPANEKLKMRKQVGFNDNIQFMWVSHDKPIKGIDVVLEAWKLFYDPAKNVTLNIIGTNRTENIPGVIFRGRIPNKDLPGWYQAADIFVFSPLRNEGFGLSLAEAISCGCMCISTYAGGIVDFFKEGEYGIAIREPNFLHVWAAAFEQAITELPAFKNAHAGDHLKPPPFSTYDEWCAKFTSIFRNLQKRLGA